VPGKCSGLTVSDITKNACRLRWKPPEDDGGSRVTHYVVERQEVGKPYWTTIATFAKVRPPSVYTIFIARILTLAVLRWFLIVYKWYFCINAC